MGIRTLGVTAAAALVLGGIAVAQTVYRPSETRVAPPVATAAQQSSAQVVQDPVAEANRLANLALKRQASLESRVVSLENRVAAVETTVRKIQPTLAYRCSVDSKTSINSVGVVEDCSPYLCAPIDGRCLKQATSSGDCRLNFHWDNERSCVPN